MSIWFCEKNNNLSFNYKVRDILYNKNSKYQNIKVLDTYFYGLMLIIDDYVMLSEKDEFIYHEMIANIGVLYHNLPKKILIIGGGDGGTARELLRYKFIKQIFICEIDQDVIDVSKKYFKNIANGLNDKKVSIFIEDGAKFIKNFNDEFDLIIIDSTDPIGPGIKLFDRDFYKNISKALKKDGMMIAQTGSAWNEDNNIKNIYENISINFRKTYPYIASIPTYPTSLWTWALAVKNDICLDKFNIDRFDNVKSNFKYLNLNIIKSTFALPNFYKKKIISN